jgi:uncharacterized protein YaaN involved in tellurite resistance
MLFPCLALKFNKGKSMSESAGPAEIFYQNIPQYAEADTATRQKMDELIATIDPENIHSIMRFGNEPLERLSEISDRLIAVQEASNVFVREFTDTASSLSLLDPSSLVEKTGQLVNKGTQVALRNKWAVGAGLAALFTVGPLAAVGALGAGKAIQVAKEQKKDKTQKLADELGESLLKARAIEGRLRDAKEKIPAVMDDVQTLGRARLQAFSALNLYIGAGQEGLRRLDEDVLPAAKTEADSNVDVSERLENLIFSRGLLDTRLTDLVSSRTVSFTSAATLMAVKKLLPTLLSKIEGHLSTSLRQWRDQIAQGGLVLAAHQLARGSQEADQFGDKLMANNVNLAIGVEKLVRDTASRGAFDPEIVIKATQKLTDSFNKDTAALAVYQQDLEGTRQKLVAASESLKTAVTGSQQRAIAGALGHIENKVRLTHQPI